MTSKVVQITPSKGFNDTNEARFLGHRLDKLFEGIVEEYPTNIALVCENEEVTYRELNATANKLARHISRKGVAQGDLVGLAVERSANLLVAILAVLKLGAAYVPIDSNFPEQRISHMIEDAEPKLILISKASSSQNLRKWSDICLTVDEENDIEDSANLDINIQPTDPAYVIYTSGSTGRPKGVEVGHGAATNFLLSLRHHEPGCTPQDRLLAITTISFDMSLLELLLPPLSGATIVLARKEAVRDPEELLHLIRSHNITMLQATPATWSMLCETGWTGEPRLSKVICGGEVFSRHLANRLLKYADSVWNVYGPSETTYGSVGRVMPGDGPVCVGRPVVNGRIYLLNDDLAPVEPGEIGEIYIGGASVSNGYRNRPELTKSRFLPNPFDGGFFFCTGDLARFIAPGELECIGRRDGMVKIHGNRIEVGDIEAVVLSHDAVSETVVIDRDDRLIAYCVSKSRTQKLAALETAMQTWLANRLPAYMVPSFVVFLDRLPLSPNRKVDRAALPDPAKMSLRHAVPDSTKPSTGIDYQIREIWVSVLGHDQFGIDDGFFQIGGDSVRLVRVQALIQERLHKRVSVPVLFEHFTIRTLAAYLAGSSGDSNTAVQEARDETREQRPAQPHLNDSDIAIVSMACRLPGNVDTPESFWDLLELGVDAIGPVPKSRWDAESLFSADPDEIGKSYCKAGGFLDDRHVSSCDLAFFGISPREAQDMSAEQLLALEVGWEALERAGMTREALSGSDTGVFLGASTNVATLNLDAPMDGYSITGSASAVLAGRLSYILGLEGPAMTIDTACSSSLVATHLACNALRLGECDAALAGGVSILSSPGIHIEFSRLRGLSPDGKCRAFAADTEGTGFSEGCGIVVLKRLVDARRDGDKILAVIRGSGVTHGGRAASLTAPSGPGQSRLIRKTIRAAQLEPADIDYIEAHGTATRLGDPIEGSALDEVFRGSHDASKEQQPLWVGSCKSNIGHAGAAAGVAGLIKVILALQHEAIPKTLHAEMPTPAVDWDGAGMALVQKQQPWLRTTASHIRRAGVSSYGISGTGAHIVLEEAYSQQDPAAHHSRMIRETPLSARELVFPISARNRSGLVGQVSMLERFIRETMNDSRHQIALADVAFSLAKTRTHFEERLVVKASTKDQLLEELARVSAELREPVSVKPAAPAQARVAFLFTGQGSQALGMGKELYETNTVFRTALDEAVTCFDHQLEHPLLQVMWADAKAEGEKSTLLNRTDFAQAAIFCVEFAVWKLWTALGVQPHSLLGHSVGEFAVAVAAGVLSLSDAAAFVAARGRLMCDLPAGQGDMVVIEASAAEIEAAMLDPVIDVDLSQYPLAIAACNTPQQTVISGHKVATAAVANYFSTQQPSRKTKVLTVSHAFHSPLMRSILPELRIIARKMTLHPANVPVLSGRTGKLVNEDELQDPEYWVQHVVDTVRFSDAIAVAAAHPENGGVGADTFLEIGPLPVLCGMGMECLASRNMDTINQSWLPSLKPRKHDFETMLESSAALHLKHVPLNWAAAFAGLQCKQVELPTYAFDRTCLKKKDNTSSPVIKMATSKESPAVIRQHQEERESVKHRYEIRWHVADASDMDIAQNRGASWGIYCQGRHENFTLGLRKVLSRTGVTLHEVYNLTDAASLDVLVCPWRATEGDDDRPRQDDDVLHHARALSTAVLSQLQDFTNNNFRPTLVWVTFNAVGITLVDEVRGSTAGSMHLAAAPLWGLARTARSEHSDLQLRLVDLDGEDEASVRALLQALDQQQREPECAVRKGRILVPRLETLPRLELAQSNAFHVRTGGAVLVTGAMGDIGKDFCRRLVRKYKVVDLVLVSRRGMEARGAREFVDEMASAGARATILPVDIGDRASVKALLAFFSESRPLRGVFHAAGVIDDGVLSGLTPGRLDAVYRPKMDGSWHLHNYTRGMDLDFFIMCSSLSGIVGNPGQANYAAANTFLDALAHERRCMGLPGTAVSFGLWAGSEGMGARIGAAARARFADEGLGSIDPVEGLELVEQVVQEGCPHAVVAAYHLEKLKTHLIEDLNGVPAMFQTLLDQTPAVGGIPGSSLPEETTPKAPLSTSLRSVLAAADPGDREDILLDAVQGEVAKVLGFSSKVQVDVDQPLPDLGVDSLMSIVTRNRLAALTELSLAARIVYEHRNLRSLSAHLLAQLQPSLGSLSTGSKRLSSTSDGSTRATSLSSSDRDVANFPFSISDKAYLAPEIKFPIPRTSPNIPNRVFITGATGFVGAFVTGLLLAQGVHVSCLVRPASRTKSSPKERVVRILQDYSLWSDTYEQLISITPGDVSVPYFGLSQQSFNELADEVDAICHAAAMVDWLRPVDDYIGPNVTSTHEVLRLASTATQRSGHTVPIHHISTIAVLPRYMGVGVDPEQTEYGYSTSKWAAEQLVHAARFRGARASVYRLPYVSAAAQSGQFRRDRGDFLHNLVAGSIELGGIFPHIGDAKMELVFPVDYLAKCVVHAITNNDGAAELGRDVNFVNNSERAQSFDEYFTLFAKSPAVFAVLAREEGSTAGESKHAGTIISYHDWRRLALDYASGHPESALARISAVIDSYVLTEKDAVDTFSFGGVGSTDHLAKDVEIFPVAPPLFDELYATAYFNAMAASRGS